MVERDMVMNQQDEVVASPDAGLSLAYVAFVIVLLLAGISRFYQLDLFPLSPTEASEALSVWQAWQPTIEEILSPSSPAYFSLTSLASQVLGDSDVIMRFVPAIFGMVLVGLPWLLRQKIGVVGALVASFILAISPLGVNVARTVGGTTIAMTALLLLAIAVLRYATEGEKRWLWLGAGALGMGLTSAPLFYSGVVALLLAWLLQRTVGPLLSDELPHISNTDKRWLIITFGLTFLGLGTWMLWFPAGIGSAGNIIAEWILRFGGTFDFQTWMTPILVLGRYEPIIVIMGGWAALWVTWDSQPLASFLVYWLIGGMLLLFLQFGELGNVLLLTLPGSLLVGHFAQQVFDLPRMRLTDIQYPIGMMGMVILLGAICISLLARHIRVNPVQTNDYYYLMMLVALMASLGAFSVLYFGFLDVVATWQGVFAGIFLLLAAFTWGTAWWLSFDAYDDTRTRWVETATDDDLPIMIETMMEIGRQHKRSEQGLSILMAVQSPVLAWYTRHMDKTQITATMPKGTNEDIVITWADDAEQYFGIDYIGADFGFIRHDSFQTLTTNQTLRGLLFHDELYPFTENHIIMWVKQDLVQP